MSPQGGTIAESLRIARLEEALRLIAAPKRPDGSWNRDREACRKLAEEALKCERSHG